MRSGRRSLLQRGVGRPVIPRFPAFKPIEPTDRDEIDAFVSGFPPYSDFNFLSLFCWDTRGVHALSRHHGNLVVRFSDYVTGTPFYSFLGISSVHETAEDLVALSTRDGIDPMLRLVPETSVFAGGSTLRDAFVVEEDADSHDYIFDIGEFLGLKGRIYKNKRRHIAAFQERHPGVRLETLDPTDQGVCRELWTVWECWEGSHETAWCCSSERAAFARALDHATEFDIRVMGLRIDGKLAGFNLNEAVHDGYSMGHYGKTDSKLTGMCDLLEYESARIMVHLGARTSTSSRTSGWPACARTSARSGPRVICASIPCGR